MVVAHLPLALSDDETMERGDFGAIVTEENARVPKAIFQIAEEFAAEYAEQFLLSVSQRPSVVATRLQWEPAEAERAIRHFHAQLQPVFNPSLSLYFALPPIEEKLAH